MAKSSSDSSRVGGGRHIPERKRTSLLKGKAKSEPSELAVKKDGKVGNRSKISKTQTIESINKSRVQKKGNPVEEKINIIKMLISPQGSAIMATQSSNPTSKSSSKSSAETSVKEVGTPFKELLSSLIMSRPFNHQMGERTIQKLTSKPHVLTSPNAILAVGKNPKALEKLLEEARSTHRGKQSKAIIDMAQKCVEDYCRNPSDTSLEKLRAQAKGDAGKIRDLVTNSFRGIGDTGVDIFHRRMQAVWPEMFPYIDSKTAGSLRTLGLPSDAGTLEHFIASNWRDLADFWPSRGEDQQRRMFVNILDNALDADLNNRIGDVLEKSRALPFKRRSST